MRRGGSNRPSRGPSCFVYAHQLAIWSEDHDCELGPAADQQNCIGRRSASLSAPDSPRRRYSRGGSAGAEFRLRAIAVQTARNATLRDSLGAQLLVIGEGGRARTRDRCAVSPLCHHPLVVIIRRRARTHHALTVSVFRPLLCSCGPRRLRDRWRRQGFRIGRGGGRRASVTGAPRGQRRRKGGCR